MLQTTTLAASLATHLNDLVLEEGLNEEDIAYLQWVLEDPRNAAYTHRPVSFKRFVESPYFLDSNNVLYPEVLRCGEDMNSGNYVEAVLTGAIGTGKTTLALFSTAYQLYLLSCLINPHEAFGLDPSSEILFIFQSINASLAKAVDYERFKAMIHRSPYFSTHFPYQHNIASELRFPNRIIVKPLSGLETGAIGQNVIGGCFPKTQQVLTSEGILKTLGEVLNVQQNFFTIDELNCLIPSDTTRGVITGTKPFIKLKFDNGEEMVCTSDQKFKGVDNDWIIARDSIGRDFRFTTVQYMREQGYLLDSASENGSSDVGETQDVCSRLCTGEVLPGGEVNVCDRQGLQLESKDAECGHASPCNNPRNVEGSRSASDVSVDGKELQETNDPLLRKDTCEILSIRCIEIVEGYLLDGTSYDIENIGGTHVFFAKTENGFLHAKNCIDEMNFMALIEKSKSSMDGGVYDQAVALYNSISRRRKSRFMQQGKLPGLLCLVSSKRYPGQFTDKKEEEARKEQEMYGKTTIYLYDKRVWEIKPEGSFSGTWFRIFTGDVTRKARILTEDDNMYDIEPSKIMAIPEEYRMEFESDMMNSLRDIAGISTMATHPFILDQDMIHKAMRKDRILFSQEYVDFMATKLSIHSSELYRPDEPRFVHIDLAVTGDSAGFCVGFVQGFQKLAVGNIYEFMPEVFIDAALEIRPPKNGEIMFAKIREVIYTLKKLGLNIYWVSFDSFQSVDSMQILKQGGYIVGRQSMDTTNAPYEFVKNALYSGRLSIPNHSKLAFELASLEKDVKNNRIDHSPHGCFVGETQVMCSDWRRRTLEELVGDREVGRIHYGYSFDIETGETVHLPLEDARITKYTDDLVEVVLDNGNVFRCTPEHRFLLTDGTYKEAQYLTPDDDLQC